MLEVLSQIATIIVAPIAAITLIFALFEYRKQGKDKKAEFFIIMRQRLKENPAFENIRTLLDSGDKALEGVPLTDRMNYLSYFEEVAILLNTKMISDDIAHYMFGYYAIRCSESKHFWKGINKESHYWSLFNKFAGNMKKVEERRLKDKTNRRIKNLKF